MFNKEELNYLLLAVNQMPVNDTQVAKNKAFMLGKIAELMDMPEPPVEQPKAAPKKKAPRKKVVKKK